MIPLCLELWLVALLGPGLDAHWELHTSPALWSEPRVFHTPFDPQFEERIRMERLPERSIEKLATSPNGAYWLGIAPEADCSAENSVVVCSSVQPDIDILISIERPYLLAIRVSDRYPNFAVRTRWISEKLVMLRVWWGRVLGSDLVIDVEQERFLYREMVHDGSIPFQQFTRERAEP